MIDEKNDFGDEDFGKYNFRCFLTSNLLLILVHIIHVNEMKSNKTSHKTTTSEEF